MALPLLRAAGGEEMMRGMNMPGQGRRREPRGGGDEAEPGNGATRPAGGLGRRGKAVSAWKNI